MNRSFVADSVVEKKKKEKKKRFILWLHLHICLCMKYWWCQSASVAVLNDKKIVLLFNIHLVQSYGPTQLFIIIIASHLSDDVLLADGFLVAIVVVPDAVAWRGCCCYNLIRLIVSFPRGRRSKNCELKRARRIKQTIVFFHLIQSIQFPFVKNNLFLLNRRQIGIECPLLWSKTNR